jgi:hypothetical protein
MITKLIKTPPARLLAAIPDTEYVVLSDGTVARRLKPYVVNTKVSYNMMLDGVLRRVSSRKLLAAAKAVA